MQGNRRKKRLESDQQFYYNSYEPTSKVLLPQKIQEFHKCTQKLAEFIEKVAHIPETQKSNIMFNYCGKYLEWQQEPAAINNFFEKRLQTIIRSRRVKKNWNKQDHSLLLWVLHQHCALFNIQSIYDLKASDWEEIASYIPGASADSCMFRILSLKTYKLSQKKWCKPQERILLKIISEIQQEIQQASQLDWKHISEKLYHENSSTLRVFRTAKQCKQHWNCYLNPILKKGPWSIEEDIKLMELTVEHDGYKRWSKLAKLFKGRTENALKNRFNFLIKNEEKENQMHQNELLIAEKLLKKLQNSPQTQNEPINHHIESNMIEVKRQNVSVFIEQSEKIPEQNYQGVSNIQSLNFNPEIHNSWAFISQPQSFPIYYNGYPYYFIMGNQHIQ